MVIYEILYYINVLIIISDIKMHGMILLLVGNIFFFLMGNYIYTLDTYLIIKVLVSELCFICLYTFVDRGNILYGWKFTIISLMITLQFLLPFYSSLYYSSYVQVFSISISTVALLVNSLIVRKLLNNGFTKIFSSRVSSIGASAVEICCFAFLLDIGIKGAITTAIVRILYIIVVPKIVFVSFERKNKF